MNFFEYLGNNPAYLIVVCIAFALTIIAVLVKYPILNAINKKRSNDETLTENDNDDSLEKTCESRIDDEILKNENENSDEEQGE